MDDKFTMHDEGYVAQAIAAAVKAAVEAMPVPLDRDELVKNAIHVLRAERTSALWSLLGFDNSWGQWKFDRCNGRDSPASRWFEEDGMAPLRTFLNAEFEDVLEKRTAEFRAHIRKDIEGHITAQINELGVRDRLYTVRRAFETIMHEEVKAAVEARRGEIRDSVVKALELDPENYRAEKR